MHVAKMMHKYSCPDNCCYEGAHLSGGLGIELTPAIHLPGLSSGGPTTTDSCYCKHLLHVQWMICPAQRSIYTGLISQCWPQCRTQQNALCRNVNVRNMTNAYYIDKGKKVRPKCTLSICFLKASATLRFQGLVHRRAGPASTEIVLLTTVATFFSYILLRITY